MLTQDLDKSVMLNNKSIEWNRLAFWSQKGYIQHFNRKVVERLRESISLSKLIQQWNVVALKQRVLFNIK